MWQGSKPNYYTVRTANGALLFLLVAYALIDLFEFFLYWISGFPLDAAISIWLRILMDVPILIIAFVAARPVPALKLHPPRAKNMVYSLLLSFFLYLTLSVLIRMLTAAFAASGIGTTESTTSQVMNEQPFLISFLFYCVLAPVTEETLFRGMLQNAYERRLGWGAVVLAGVMFGLMHSGIPAIINGIAAGLMLGFLYIKTRSLWCTIAFHAMFNLFAFTLVPDYYIINLPWVLGFFPAESLTYADPLYLAYNIGIVAIGMLMCYVLIQLLCRDNPENTARRSSAYVHESSQWISSTAIVVLLCLRLGMSIATSF